MLIDPLCDGNIREATPEEMARLVRTAGTTDNLVGGIIKSKTHWVQHHLDNALVQRDATLEIL